MSLSDDTLRHLKDLERRYKVKDDCPDMFTGYEIAAIRIQHEKMARCFCQWCGAPTAQPIAFLGRPSTCQICAVLNP